MFLVAVCDISSPLANQTPPQVYHSLSAPPHLSYSLNAPPQVRHSLSTPPQVCHSPSTHVSPRIRHSLFTGSAAACTNDGADRAGTDTETTLFFSDESSSAAVCVASGGHVTCAAPSGGPGRLTARGERRWQ